MKIFISYRQNDSPGDCRQLAERLQQHFGQENVFLDVQSIKLGENWWTVVRNRIRSSDVLLVPIGQNWLTAKDKNGNRRLDDPRDPLRREISLALAEGIRTIPILVEGASMPAPESLPEDLHDFADLNACELRHRSFSRDVDALIEDLAGMVPGGGATVPAEEQSGVTPFSGTGPPPAAPPFVPPAAGLTGRWQSMTGILHTLLQQGNVVMIESRNNFNYVVFQGQGTITGNQLYFGYSVAYQPPYITQGNAQCIVSPDGQTITGQMSDPVMGMQHLTWRRVG